MGKEKKDFFEVTDPSKEEVPQVNFDTETKTDDTKTE